MHRRPFRSVASCLCAFSLLTGATPAAPAAASPARVPPLANAHVEATVPSGFYDELVISGLTNPTVVRFAADGRVFVAEKSGLIKVFDSLTDTSPTVFADLRTKVHNFWDRGLLGLALAPGFPSDPSVYVMYAHDAAIGGTAPRWGTAGATSDPCPSPPGATADGCVISGRISRFTASGNVGGAEQVLLEDWCQQYPSHSVGSLQVGPDGMLYATGGDGASFTFVDYGQDGSPLNPCGDPPGGVGSVLTPPTAAGGALRSQDLRTPTADPVSLDGTLIRIDPVTGAAPPDNPNAGAADLKARRIIAYGMRNPFRFAFRPGTNELWSGDVGWGDWEEINRISDPVAAVRNLGWPCYEGTGRQSGYDGANLNLCEGLYAEGPSAVTPPYLAYNHSATVVPNETCPAGSSSISGVAFYQGGPYPASYDGALFFSDYSRDCIWAMPLGANGLPDPANLETFAAGAANPVHMEIGPNGDLFYVDFDGGAIRRIAFGDEPLPPPPTTDAFLSDLATVSETNGWGPLERDTSNGEDAAGDGGTITLNGTTFSKGLGVHALSEATFHLGGNCSRFRADIGVDDEVGSAGSVIFRVYADDSEIYASTTRTGSSASIPLDLDVATTAMLRLRVEATADGNASDHADWAGARVVCGSGQPGGLTFTAEADTYVNNKSPNKNYGTGTELRVREGTGTPQTTTWRSYLRFDVAGLAGAVDSATLRVWATNNSSDGGSVYSTSASWSETGMTWSSAPTIGGSSLGSAGSITGGQWEEIPLTVSGFAGGNGTYGLAVKSGSPTNAVYESREGAHAPQLVITTAVGGSNTPPSAAITTPTAATTWSVGTVVGFDGTATDAQDGTLPASAFNWSLIMHHCPSNCHSHAIQDFDGVRSGSFTAPDHEYPSHLELQLIVTDSGGLTDTTSVLLQPNTVDLTLQTVPSGLSLGFNAVTATAPFTRTVIVGSTNSLIAPTSQSAGGQSYDFAGWSDGGAATHNIVAPAAATTFTATYQASGGGQTSTFNSSADTYVSNMSSNRNYGTEATIKVREGTPTSTTSWRSFLRFDVSGLAGPVSSVKLRLYCTDFSTDGGSVYAIGGGWSETGTTWNTAPTISGSALGSAGTVNSGAYIEITLDPSAITGDGTYSFALKSNDTNNVYYQSREGVNPPQLVISTGS